MASHEFRTPLSTVLSSAYLIEKYTKSEDQTRRENHLHRIISSVNLLTDILNDFLSVGKIEEGKIPLRLAEFNIREWLRLIMQDMSIHLKKGQRFDYVHNGSEKVFLDQVLLKHIAMNLFSNAIKFSPEESKIVVETEVTNEKIRFSVIDRGIGISAEDQEHLMERFFRGSNAANIQGTGLGLYIVSKYAQRMNGKIQCISSLYQGTTFNVFFKPINQPL
jgi:signal transduction histidine kinase